MARKNPFDDAPEPTESQNADDQPQDETVAPAEPGDEQARPEVEVPKTPEQERDELMARLQRLAADYQNYQKRAAKDMTQAREFANEGLMKALLGVLDDMERALEAAGQHHGQDDPFYTGMQMVHDKMLATLGQFGLTRMDAAGQPFDPERHQALMQQPTTEVDPMTVLQVVQQGYELKGRTLRPANVIVSRAPEEEEQG